MWWFFLALFKSDKIEYILQFFLSKVLLPSLLIVVTPSVSINPIQDGHFQGCSRWGAGGGGFFGGLCHAYPTMMKLGTVIPYLKKIQKIYQSRDTHPDFCWYQHFLSEIIKFCYSKKCRYRIRISNSFNFSWVFEDFLNKPGCNFDDVSKNGYLRPF